MTTEAQSPTRYDLREAVDAEIGQLQTDIPHERDIDRQLAMSRTLNQLREDRDAMPFCERAFSRLRDRYFTASTATATDPPAASVDTLAGAAPATDGRASMLIGEFGRAVYQRCGIDPPTDVIHRAAASGTLGAVERRGDQYRFTSDQVDAMAEFIKQNPCRSVDVSEVRRRSK